MQFFKAAGLNESIAEDALKLVQSFVEGVRVMITSNSASILFSATSSRVTSLEPTTDSAFFMSLFSLFASFALMPAPQDTTAKKMVLATTDSSGASGCRH